MLAITTRPMLVGNCDNHWACISEEHLKRFVSLLAILSNSPLSEASCTGLLAIDRCHHRLMPHLTSFQPQFGQAWKGKIEVNV